MIAETIQLLQSDNFYGAGKIIEIAKGKNELAYTFKEGKEKIIRLWQSLRR
jgi:hypothetical protein